MRTLGEAKVFAKEHAIIENGEVKLCMPPHKRRMSYVEACNYYNNKLFVYWLTQFAKELSETKKSELLKYLKSLKEDRKG